MTIQQWNWLISGIYVLETGSGFFPGVNNKCAVHVSAEDGATKKANHPPSFKILTNHGHGHESLVPPPPSQLSAPSSSRSGPSSRESTNNRARWIRKRRRMWPEAIISEREARCQQRSLSSPRAPANPRITAWWREAAKTNKALWQNSEMYWERIRLYCFQHKTNWAHSLIPHQATNQIQQLSGWHRMGFTTWLFKFPGRWW